MLHKSSIWYLRKWEVVFKEIVVLHYSHIRDVFSTFSAQYYIVQKKCLLFYVKFIEKIGPTVCRRYNLHSSSRFCRQLNEIRFYFFSFKHLSYSSTPSKIIKKENKKPKWDVQFSSWEISQYKIRFLAGNISISFLIFIPSHL